MTTTALRGVRLGTVGAYLTSGDVTRVRQLRAQVGRVTLSGKAGSRTLSDLARDDDLAGVDFDPAMYLENGPDQGLFPPDWVGRQRDLGLDVIRSEGRFARRNDPDSLKHAFAGQVGAGVVRVVSFSEFWLRRHNVGTAAAAIRNCNDSLAFVFAALFDPLEATESIDSLRLLMEAASTGERSVELLRTDTHGIPFAIHGGTRAAIGLISSGRHHPQPMNQSTREKFERRQQSVSVWVPKLMGWQQGAKLESLRPFGGAGISDCECASCDGADLMRFAREWPRVPANVRAEAQAHDVASWVELRNSVLGAADPSLAWGEASANALAVESTLANQYKITALKAPHSLRDWS
jgi:hypothetical protein